MRGQTLAHTTKQLRTQYGIKIDPSYLSKIENGKVEVPLRTLMAIADYFSVDPGGLISEGEGGIPKELRGILMDEEFINNLRRLRMAVGEETIVRHMRDTVDEWLRLLDSAERSGTES